jgi:hypothetical protein
MQEQKRRKKKVNAGKGPLTLRRPATYQLPDDPQNYSSNSSVTPVNNFKNSSLISNFYLQRQSYINNYVILKSKLCGKLPVLLFKQN